uniref:Putative carboxypeptidase a1 n=1 Tax=Lutzomyia longipalpis TaxID=7200 RepID=A0A1B0C9X1_LUTLO
MNQLPQMSILTSSQRSESDESGSSEEYYEEDLLYYDGDDDGDESSSDDDDSSADEDSIESPPIRAKPTVLRPPKEHNLQAKPWIPPTGQEYINSAKPINAQENILKRKRRRPAAPSSSSEDSYEDYDDQEEEEEEFSLEDTFKYGSPVKENVFDYFGNVMSRFGKFITSLMGLGGGGKRKKQHNQQDNQVVSTYSTAPKIDQLGNDVEHKEANDQGVHEKGMWSGLGTWFAGDNTEITTIPNEMTEDKSWFFNIFSSPTVSTTTTTEKPETTSLNPLDPGNFIALLAQHLVTTEKPDEQKPESLGGQIAQKKVDYSNYQLWRLRPSNAWQVRFLSTLRSSVDCEKCQWWKGPSLRGPTDLAIPPESLAFIEETLQSQGIVYEAVISDLQKAITYSNPKMTRREHYEIEMEQGHPVTFYRYHRFDDIVKFLEFLQRKYPDHVELSHFGRSFEGLPLIMVKIFSQANGTMELRYGRGPRKRPTERKFLKPVVMIEAGSHGREWIAPAVAMWILNTLAMGIGRNDSQSEIYRSVDWLIVPVLNPDGYEYTHTHDRLWRKTRSRARPKKMGFLNSLPFWTWFQGDSTEEELNCTGVDLNRNWSYEWTPKGITSKPCGDLYSGSKALSEPESAALHQFAMKHKKRITVFISLHSYGQMISVPKELHGRNDDLIDMAHVAAQALNGHSSLNRYLVDDANEMLFPRPGAVDSFMLNTIGVPYSYTLELRDTGTHGFLLPPSYIEATARDAFDIIKAIVDNL